MGRARIQTPTPLPHVACQKYWPTLMLKDQVQVFESCEIVSAPQALMST